MRRHIGHERAHDGFGNGAPCRVHRWRRGRNLRRAALLFRRPAIAPIGRSVSSARLSRSQRREPAHTAVALQPETPRLACPRYFARSRYASVTLRGVTTIVRDLRCTTAVWQRRRTTRGHRDHQRSDTSFRCMGYAISLPPDRDVGPKLMMDMGMA